MRFFPLLLANLLRKKIRTALTVGSFAVALFLFGLLAMVQGAFSQGSDASGADRLVVINRVSIIQSLPVSYQERMLRIPGVKLVTHQNWFGGVYQDERNFFAQYANDDETFHAMYPEYVVSDPEWQAYMADRQGALAGEALAKRFKWRVGDRIPLKGTIFGGVWEFNLRGIYHGKQPQDDISSFFFHYTYLDERRIPYWKGTVGFYEVEVSNPEDAGKVAKRIDQEFANSPWETKSDTERAFLASFMRQSGDIAFLIRSIGAVVFFTLLLVSGNTMAIAVRERVRELAVLKAIGFSDVFVLWLVLAEAVLVAILGGAVGLALVNWVSLHIGALTSGILTVFYLAPHSLVTGVGLAVLVGVIAGFWPAFSAMRLNVVEAMRKV